MSRCPQQTGMSRLCCAGRAEGSAGALGSGGIRQAWLCMGGVGCLCCCAVCEHVREETRVFHA